MILLDTAVIWSLANPDPVEDAPLLEWAASLSSMTLFISAASTMEFEAGANRMERTDKAASLAIRQWLDERLRPAFQGRTLAIDDAVVRRWSKLSYADLGDGLMAATAQEHGLTLATRDAGCFRSGKLRLLNPWTYSADAEDDWRRASHGTPQWLKSLFVRA